MARPSKSTVDYFPHYIKGGKTLFILETDFGNDGYAFWFKLLEVLGNTNGMYFDYSDPANARFLQSKTRLSESFCHRILDTLAVLNTIDRELWENHRIIWCQNLVDNVQDAFKKRTSAMPKKPSFSVSDTGNPPKEGVSAPKTPENDELTEFSSEETGKGKERKGKGNEIKGEEREEDLLDPKDPPLPPKPITPFRLFEEGGFGTLSAVIGEMIGDLIDTYSEQWVIEAMKEAVLYGKRSLSYVTTILKRWQSEGIDTPWKKGENANAQHEGRTEGVRSGIHQKESGRGKSEFDHLDKRGWRDPDEPE